MFARKGGPASFVTSPILYLAKTCPRRISLASSNVRRAPYPFFSSTSYSPCPPRNWTIAKKERQRITAHTRLLLKPM